MPTLRLALAQVNPTVGDLAGNRALVVDWARRALDAGADVAAFPEMVVTGYPVEDLALRGSFVEASLQAAQALAADLEAAGCGELPVVVGYLGRADVTQAPTEEGQSEHGVTGVPQGLPQNCAAVLHRGVVHAEYAKHHLPNYGVFDEFRVFVSGSDVSIFRVGDVDIALAICEDIWQDGGPVADVAATGADVLLVLNGSPYEQQKDDTRLALVRRRAEETKCHVAYVNLVGGQDDIVFDGDSIVVAPDGTVLARAPQFVDHLSCVELDIPASENDHAATVAGRAVRRTTLDASLHGPEGGWNPPGTAIAPPLDDTTEIYHALVSGLRDYVHKNGFRSVVLGLSGGIDSALVAALACDAIGSSNVYGVSMPSEYSSQHSRDDAADLAERTGLNYRTVAIKPMVDIFIDALSLEGLAEENIQARVRGNILMAISNAEGHLVLATGNKSEMSVGYSTIYGDSVGGFAPLKDVPKTVVWNLARWRNNHLAPGERSPIPKSSITKPPSAELRPGQVDSDSLPSYDVLDAILRRYVEDAKGRDAIIADGFGADVVDKVVGLVDRAEWKRRQFAPGTKISPVAFGRDRRLPITSRWREERSSQQ